MSEQMYGIERYIQKILVPKPENEFQIDSIEYSPGEYTGLSSIDPSYTEPMAPMSARQGALRDTAAKTSSRSEHHRALWRLIQQGSIRLVPLDTRYFRFHNSSQNRYLPDAKVIFDDLGREWFKRKGTKLYIYSGYRGPRNGGSAHDVGAAADFNIIGNHKDLAYELADLAYSAKLFGGIALAHTANNNWMIHLDVGKGTGSGPTTWTYNIQGWSSQLYRSPAERRGRQ